MQDLPHERAGGDSADGFTGTRGRLTPGLGPWRRDPPPREREKPLRRTAPRRRAKRAQVCGLRHRDGSHVPRCGHIALKCSLGASQSDSGGVLNLAKVTPRASVAGAFCAYACAVSAVVSAFTSPEMGATCACTQVSPAMNWPKVSFLGGCTSAPLADRTVSFRSRRHGCPKSQHRVGQLPLWSSLGASSGRRASWWHYQLLDVGDEVDNLLVALGCVVCRALPDDCAHLVAAGL